MQNPKARPVKMWTAVLVCAVGILLFSTAMAGWLSDSSLSGQLWPNDINLQIVQLLGGTRSTNAVGDHVTSLGLSSVAGRLTGLLLLLGVTLQLIGQRRKHGNSEGSVTIASTLLQSGVILGISSGWWAIWLIGATTIPVMLSFALSCLSLWLMCSLAALAMVWWMAFATPIPIPLTPSTQPAASRTPLIVLVCSIVWIATSFWMNKCLYDQLLIPHGDSAMYEEHLWNIWHGKGFRSYLDQGLFLGEHVQVIHLLLLPLHRIWPSHLLLELAESIALGSCTIPIFRIAFRHTGCRQTATCISIAWLFYFPMHFLDIAIDQKTFRPIALGVPFIFWLIEFTERRLLTRAATCLLIALSAKEDMALVLAPLMGAMAIRTSKIPTCQHGMEDGGGRQSTHTARWLTGGSIFCAVYLVLVVLVIIPSFRSGNHVHYSQYFGDLGGTPGELVRTAISSPGRVIAKALSLRTAIYGLVFLAPLAFLPIRKPMVLSTGLLTFGMLSLLELGDGPLPPVPYHHFHAPLLTVVFWAACVSLSDLSRYRRILFARSALLCCLASGWTGSLMPLGATFWSAESRFGYSQLYQPANSHQQHRAEMVTTVLQQIPPTARVASTDFIHTRLTHRERSYDYSGYLRAVNNYQPGVPNDTEYIVIDTGHFYSKIKSPSDVRELQESPDEWELLPDQTDGLFIILKRNRSN